MQTISRFQGELAIGMRSSLQIFIVCILFAHLCVVHANTTPRQDPEAAFGLSGDVVRFVKKGTWASMVLLLLTLVIVRSPIMGAFRPDDTVELAKKEERAELDRQGKALPGIRPFPSLQATQEEVEAAGGTNIKVVDDVDISKGNGVTVNIGNGQKIKLMKKKAQPSSQVPDPVQNP